MELPRLRHERHAAGFSQEGLAERSGVHRDTISRLERGRQPARPSTIKKLADALGVETGALAKNRKETTVEQTRPANKVEVEVRWEDKDGRMRKDGLRFRGQEIGAYEEGSTFFTLYECPGGYRVHVENGHDGTAYLCPSRPEYAGGLEYPTYTAEELVEEFPAFGEEVGVYRVRDID